MKLTEPQIKALRAVLRARPRAELKRAFSVIRNADDRTLLAAALPRANSRAKRAADPLLRELERTLRPIMAPAREKADLLVEHLAKRHRRKLEFQPKGLADAARRLRTKFSDEQISAGAKSLVAELSTLYGDRETVV